ncbi:MAG: 5'-deoxynucleotidase [Bdellovibrionota bacterium]
MTQHHHFFAYLARMKLIDRWSLMRCTQRENVQEHSLQVAIIAHALALVKNKHFGGRLNPEKVAVQAIFHDATEVLTGDLPTPVKYFSPEIRNAYLAIEDHAVSQMLGLLPNDLRGEYAKIFGDEDAEVARIVKSADVLAAYIKCLEEESAGNHEFSRAKKAIDAKLKSLCEQPEVRYFVEHFIPSFSLTLDEISAPLEPKA